MEAGKVPAQVAAIAVGDYVMVGVPAEFFTTPARRIREHSPFALTSVMALTNGNVRYVAEKEAFFKGSQIYGTENHQPEMAVPGTDSILADAALQCVREAREKIQRRAV